MASFNEILSMATVIYSDVIEPILCLIYAYILVRIVAAKSLNFRSEFYVFTIATGVAAISNVLLNWVLRLVDYRFQYFPDRGLFLNIDSMLSHIFALSISIGKTLSVSSRFTAICLMQKKHIWDGRVIFICLIAMFGIPTLIYCYFPAFPAVFTPTPNGYGNYIGIANPGQLIAKAFATIGYFFFFFTTVPMCLLSVLKLRSHRRLSDQLANGRQENVLTIYAVVLTTSHMFKSTIWFVALVLNMKDLQAFVVSQYLLPNTLSAFAEPVLLLLTSPKLRNEVLPWKRAGGTTSTTTIVSPMRRSSERASQMSKM